MVLQYFTNVVPVEKHLLVLIKVFKKKLMVFTCSGDIEMCCLAERIVCRYIRIPPNSNHHSANTYQNYCQHGCTTMVWNGKEEMFI